MNLDNYNNLGICSLAIKSVLSEANNLSLSKVLLIMPLLTNKSLTSHLSRSTTEIKSIEKLISEKTPLFSNFNNRYYDSIVLSINAIQFLIETKQIELLEGKLSPLSKFEYDHSMGNRVRKINLASKNISKLLQESSEKLYLNLRIEL